MKKTLLAIVLATAATAAWASCLSQTITINGRTYVCTTCCYGGNCTTNCF